MKIIRNGMTFGTILLWSVLFSQQIEPSDAYKTVLRMKISLDQNPLTHMDELKSAKMNVIYESCNTYLDLERQKVSDEKLFVQALKIKNDAENLSKVHYNRALPIKIKQNIKYNYFLTSSDND
ncbi:hypothetical protein OAK09_00775 [Candidatus Marinimicrobia bacterium]|nr:hypothetical protein [Candidatus Neomarinimicrobiota bacterium]